MRHRITNDRCKPGELKDTRIKQSSKLFWRGLGLVLKAIDILIKGDWNL